MAKLYVGNCTRQKQRVYYRLDFTVDADGNPVRGAKFSPPRQQDIPPGRQQQIGGDMTAGQIEEIVSQLNRYGMLGACEVGQQREYASYVFNVDRPVTAKVIEIVIDNNSRLKFKEGAVRRKRAALSANQTLVNQIAEENLRAVDEAATMDEAPLFEASFEQEEGAGEAGPIAEGFRVDPLEAAADDAPPAGARGRSAKRGRKA